MSTATPFARARVEKGSAGVEAGEVPASPDSRRVSVAWAGYDCVVSIGDAAKSSAGLSSVPVEIEMKTPGDGDSGPAATLPTSAAVVKIRALAIKGSGLDPTPVVVEMKSPGDGDGGPTVTIQVDA